MERTTPRSLAFHSIAVGDAAEFSRSFSATDICHFAELSGDYNPLHMSDSYARAAGFDRRVVHGMLLASLCSTLVGMYLPGMNCLYREQTLNFHKPVLVDDSIEVTGRVIFKSSATRSLLISIAMVVRGEIAMDGEAQVQVLPCEPNA
jgi:3-hydroxybutyryl-CoA dehydratase